MRLGKMNLTKKKNNKTEYSKLILLDYLDRYPSGEDFFQPSYFNDELKLSDAKSMVNSLLRQGYVEKQDGRYLLTSEGKDYVEERQDLAAFFRYGSPYAEVGEFEKIKASLKDGEHGFEEIMIKLFLKKIKTYQHLDDYQSVKDLHLDIAEFYETIDHGPQALHHYLIALYFDVSGLEYYDLFRTYMAGKCSAKALQLNYDYIYINIRSLQGIARLKAHYHDEIVDAVYENQKISINLCRKDIFKQMVKEIMDDTFVNYDWQCYFWQAYKKMITAVDKRRKKNG